MKDGLFAELKRRHVYRVAIAYVIVAWVLLQLASIIFPMYGAPDWVLKVFLTVLVLGFPVALILAWAFEVTPEGVRRTEPADSPDARPPEQHRHAGRTLDFIIIGVLVVAVALLAWQRWGRHATLPTAMATSQKSIAVLPFENLSTDKSNGYFADGMQDLILTKLSDISDLKVISRTSTLQYGSHPQNLKKIGQELGVATLLEGSVQKAGNSVLINVQLINARTDVHIWAQSYQRTLDNVFGVEGEVAEKIAGALQAKLSPEETKRLATALSSDPIANDLYLRADYYTNLGSARVDTASLKRAIPLYRQALARTLEFALARARLSYTESELAFWGGGGQDLRQLDADARAQAEQALDLAPDLAESHLAIGYCDYYGKSDYDAALTSFAVALRLRPNDADVHASRGFVLRRQGKFGEAIDALKRALTLDPRSSYYAMELGSTYMATSSYLEAEQVLRQAFMLDPGNDDARRGYARSILLRTGDVEQSLAAAQGDSAAMKTLRVGLLFLQRKYRDAIALLESIPDTPDDFLRGGKDQWIGNLYRYSGDMARARAYCAKALPVLRTQLSKFTNPTNLAVIWNAIAVVELGLGKTDAGVAAIKSALAEGEKSVDRSARPGILIDAAAWYAQANRGDQAVSLIARALATPGIGWDYSPVMLWIAPAWDPIRKDPGFQALLKKYAKYRPAKVPATWPIGRPATARP